MGSTSQPKGSFTELIGSTSQPKHSYFETIGSIIWLLGSASQPTSSKSEPKGSFAELIGSTIKPILWANEIRCIRSHHRREKFHQK
jgi:hypothetical protein